MNAFSPLTLLAALALAASASSQSKTSLIGLPHSFSVDPKTTGLIADSPRVFVKAMGFKDDGGVPGSGKPGDFAYSGLGVDYSTAAILQFDPTPADIDAFSIGLDWILSDGDGKVVVPPGHWGGLTFSVTRDSVGMTGSVVRQEHDDAIHKAGGDLFFYIFAGSALPPPLPDETFLVQDATEMDIVPDPPPAGATDPIEEPEIDAHDLYLALIYQNNPSLIAFLEPEQFTPAAFFSVSSETTGLVPTSWWGGTTPSGATIFVTLWLGSSWSTPIPFLTYADLELDDEDEVDAVAVDLVRKEMLFSTDPAGADEIMWVPLPFLCPSSATFGIGPIVPSPKAYKYPDGSKVSERAKLESTDKVDAICALDPGGNELMRRLIATPELLVPWIQPPNSWASAFRMEDNSGNVTNYTYLAGWPHTGPTPGSVAGCLVTYPGFSPLVDISGFINRNPFSVWLGDPLELQDIQFPKPIFHGLVGFDLAYQWILLDPGTLQFDVPYAALIRL